MYPNLYYALKDLLGIDWQWTKILNSFGLLLAISFLCAAIVLYREFNRKQAQGLFTPTQEHYIAGAPASISELVWQCVFGFLVGFKFLGGIVSGELQQDAQGYIASTKGNLLFGVLIGGLFAFMRWYEKDKQKLPKPEARVRNIWPKDRVGDITMLAMVGGIVGAKLFHFFENWAEFTSDPWGSITALGGLTFYGGLIVAAIVILTYAKRKLIPWKHLVDAVAPGLMIAYAVGRLGCQVSGDGDWGIYNSAYTTTPTGQVIQATPSNNMDSMLKYNPEAAHYFAANDIKQFGHIPHKAYQAPSYIPTWLVAMNYTHNVNGVGVVIKDDPMEEKYNRMLPIPVFPTPIYEFVICTLMFLTLMALRKKIVVPGVLFGIYLIMNGVERFVVETIRVNTQYHILGLKPSQAEIIAVCLVLLGVAIIYTSKQSAKATHTTAP